MILEGEGDGGGGAGGSTRLESTTTTATTTTTRGKTTTARGTGGMPLRWTRIVKIIETREGGVGLLRGSIAGGGGATAATAPATAPASTARTILDHVSGSGVWHEAGGTGAWMLAVVKGSLAVTSGGFTVNAVPGDFVVVPAALRGAELKAGPGAEWLRVTRGNGGTVA
jgi:hypothetical protein